MDLNNDYSFIASVSTRPYRDKEQARAGCRTMKFHQMELSPGIFLSLAGNGYAFCYNFRNDRRKEENFLNTQILIFDIDYPKVGMDTYIEGLPYKPTMGYTSYSNDPGESHYRFRLIYGFDSLITTEQEFDSLYLAVSMANGFGKALDRRPANQLYFGSNSLLPGFDNYNSSLVYSFSDFDKYLPEPGEENLISDCTVGIYSPTHNKHDDKNDTLQEQDWLNYYDNYLNSLETPLDLAPSGTHFTFPEKYYTVPVRFRKGYVVRWQDGEGRRQKLFRSAQIMLHNSPSLTPDNLAFNLWQLISTYYDNTKDQITKGDIDGIVERAFEKKDTFDLNSSYHKGKYKINKEFWTKQGLTTRQSVPRVMKERNQDVMRFYDPSLSVDENYNALLNEGLKVSIRTFRRYVKELGLKRDIDTEIIELMLQEPTISTKDIASTLGKSLSTISRHIKELKKTRVSRVKKQWVVDDAKTSIQSST